MTRAELFLWIFLPYASITVFVVGHVWRWRRDQFGWTSRSSQLFERRMLAWGSNLFHYGALAAIAGHVLGILIPAGFWSIIGVSEHRYHLFSVTGGVIAESAVVAGFVILVVRRIIVPSVAAGTSTTDLVAYFLLAVVIGLGVWDTTAENLLGGGYDYRQSVSIWFRGVFAFDPHAQLAASAPLVYRLHAITAWFLFALWPFSRLVHAWSYPVAYLVRPYIVYRSRLQTGRG